MVTARLKILSVEKTDTIVLLRFKSLDITKAIFPISSLDSMLYLSKSRDIEELVWKYITIIFDNNESPIAFAFDVNDRLRCWYDIERKGFFKNKEMYS